MARKWRTGPLTNDETIRIREIAANPRSNYGSVKRLAIELNRNYFTVFYSVQKHRQDMNGQNARVAAVPHCDAMIHSGKSYASLMERLNAEPMPGPDHGQPRAG